MSVCHGFESIHINHALALFWKPLFDLFGWLAPANRCIEYTQLRLFQYRSSGESKKYSFALAQGNTLVYGWQHANFYPVYLQYPSILHTIPTGKPITCSAKRWVALVHNLTAP